MHVRATPTPTSRQDKSSGARTLSPSHRRPAHRPQHVSSAVMPSRACKVYPHPAC